MSLKEKNVTAARNMEDKIDKMDRMQNMDKMNMMDKMDKKDKMDNLARGRVMGGYASPQGICASQIPHTSQPYLTVWNYQCVPV